MRRAKRGKGGGAYLGGDRGGDAFDAFVRLGAVQGGGGGGPADGGGVLPAAGGSAGRRGGRTGRGCARGSGIGGRLSALQGRGWPNAPARTGPGKDGAANQQQMSRRGRSRGKRRSAKSDRRRTPRRGRKDAPGHSSVLRLCRSAQLVSIPSRARWRRPAFRPPAFPCRRGRPTRPPRARRRP